jgi:hypothetical protein
MSPWQVLLRFLLLLKWHPSRQSRVGMTIAKSGESEEAWVGQPRLPTRRARPHLDPLVLARLPDTLPTSPFGRTVMADPPAPVPERRRLGLDPLTPVPGRSHRDRLAMRLSGSLP